MFGFSELFAVSPSNSSLFSSFSRFSPSVILATAAISSFSFSLIKVTPWVALPAKRMSFVSINYLNVKWTATDVSYVKITRRVGTVAAYTDISTINQTTPYYDTDISGNTTYYYYATPYMTKYGTITSGSVSSLVS